jgi:N-methylhydantoinase A/oxoprolinase/acetone carboxylase beta subunit
MLESGPAGGVVGTMALCEALDLDAAIAFDMSGNTAKAGVVRHGQPGFSPDYFIGGYNEGLAIRTVIVPPAPGHFSALGMLMADLRRDYVQTLFARLSTLSMGQLEAPLQQLEAEGRKALLASGVATDRIVFERAADMRYVGQEHAVTVRLPAYVTDTAARQEIDVRPAAL